MARPTSIHKGKEPNRIHYIAEWMELRGIRPADVVEALQTDKSSVSRWLGGKIPAEQNLVALAQFLEAGEPGALFRHPDDDWLARMFRARTDEERKRLRLLIEAAFPNKVA